MKRTVLSLLIAAATVYSQTGDYLGTIQIPSAGVKLRIALHIVKEADGAWKGSVDSLDQGARGLPVKLTIDGKAIRFSSNVGMSYEGQFNEAGTEIEGTAVQGPQKMALHFKKVDKIEEARRPQHPKRPFPYGEEEAVVQSGKIKLGGTLTLPKGDGPFGAVIFLTGSGAQDRDETLFEHKPFLVLSDLLTRAGYATLRMDDRGVGKSGGMLAYSNIDDLAGDAIAMFEFLKTRKEINPAKIGFLGHSEGGVTGPLAASKVKDAAFVIMLAGTGVPGDEILYEQGQAGLKAAGAPPQQLAFQLALQKKFVPLVKEETDNAVLSRKIQEAWTQLKEENPMAKAAEAQIGPSLQQFLLPTLQGFIRHDPRPVLAELKCPVLALNGTLDTQVLSYQNLPAITAALTKANHADFTIVSLPRLNHLFQNAQTGALNEYGQIEETMSPRVLDLIAQWLKARI